MQKCATAAQERFAAVSPVGSSDSDTSDRKAASMQAQVAELRSVAARFEAECDDWKQKYLDMQKCATAAQERFAAVSPVGSSDSDTSYRKSSEVGTSCFAEVCRQRDAALNRIDVLTRAISQAHIRAEESSFNLQSFKAAFVSAQADFTTCKQNYVDECSSLRLAALRIASQKVSLINEISLLKNSFLQEKDAALAAQDKLSFEKLSLMQARDGHRIQIEHLTKDLEELRSTLEATEHQKTSCTSNSSPCLTLKDCFRDPDVDSILIERTHQSSDFSAQAQLELKDQVDQAFSASQRRIAELRERVIKSELALDHERVLYSRTASRLTHAEFSMENMQTLLSDSNAKLAQMAVDFDSIVEQKVNLHNLLEESEFRLEIATTHIQELVQERTTLQHDNSQLKVDLYAIQARFVASKDVFEGAVSSQSFEQLKLKNGALVKELEELESSAQKQVDCWQKAAAISKTEVNELSIRIEKLVHENQLLLLSLENKVSRLCGSICGIQLLLLLSALSTEFTTCLCLFSLKPSIRTKYCGATKALSGCQFHWRLLRRLKRQPSWKTALYLSPKDLLK
jgi:hypothetical protein